MNANESLRRKMMERIVDKKTLEEREKAGVCRFCGKPITKFRDEASEREYRLSGLCQRCQDRMFEPYNGMLFQRTISGKETVR
ncbi:MAG: hypothetical protein QXV17_07195 [Candidatus Micrarchaeaceae archaeon]